MEDFDFTRVFEVLEVPLQKPRVIGDWLTKTGHRCFCHTWLRFANSAWSRCWIPKRNSKEETSPRESIDSCSANNIAGDTGAGHLIVAHFLQTHLEAAVLMVLGLAVVFLRSERRSDVDALRLLLKLATPRRSSNLGGWAVQSGDRWESRFETSSVYWSDGRRSGVCHGAGGASAVCKRWCKASRRTRKRGCGGSPSRRNRAIFPHRRRLGHCLLAASSATLGAAYSGRVDIRSMVSSRSIGHAKRRSRVTPSLNSLSV